ncbi:MAG TPA: CHRD domain-containing protein [Amycolatopsis sp.]|nr:CHRD domain-containing protein [Amycolatopsis sp.]
MSRRALLLSTLSLAVGITLTTSGVANAQDDTAGFAPATAASQFFSANLAGTNEVPPADPDGTATAIVRITGTEVCFALRYANITAPFAGHIHTGAAGSNGAVVVPFFAVPGGATLPANLTAVAGCVASDQATVDAITANPAGFYVNMHTTAFRAGALRGQLKKIRRADFGAFMFRGNLAADAVGAREIPGPGDPDAHSVARFDVKTDTVDFAAFWANFTMPSAAHIHLGTPSIAGPVIVPLFAQAGGLPATIMAVAGSTPAPAAVLQDIRANPRAFYYNIHNAEFPAGGARGQLFRR